MIGNTPPLVDLKLELMLGIGCLLESGFAWRGSPWNSPCQSFGKGFQLAPELGEWLKKFKMRVGDEFFLPFFFFFNYVFFWNIIYKNK
jgi:hypothetical protein